MANYTRQVSSLRVNVTDMYCIPLQKKYRNHFEIFALMLEAVKSGGARRFSIMRSTSINSAQLKKHLQSLLEMGLVEAEVERGQDVYRATSRGLEFLKHYNDLQRTMWNGNL